MPSEPEPLSAALTAFLEDVGSLPSYEAFGAPVVRVADLSMLVEKHLDAARASRPEPRHRVGDVLWAWHVVTDSGEPVPVGWTVASRPEPGADLAGLRDRGVAPSPDAPGLREALRAVLRDFDREPTEEYLTEAVRRFLAASGDAPREERYYSEAEANAILRLASESHPTKEPTDG